MATDAIAYDKAELRSIVRSFKAMDDEATDQAKLATSALAAFVQGKIIAAAGSTSNSVAPRVAAGSRVSKSSKIGEISFGFVNQKFSGGGTTQQLWGGTEFGSNKYKQFPIWSGRVSGGTRGYFIYPTLRDAQPEILEKWEQSFSKIIKKYD